MKWLRNIFFGTIALVAVGLLLWLGPKWLTADVLDPVGRMEAESAARQVLVALVALVELLALVVAIGVGWLMLRRQGRELDAVRQALAARDAQLSKSQTMLARQEVALQRSEEALARNQQALDLAREELERNRKLLRATQEQLQAGRAAAQTDRYARAVEQLGSASVEGRLGGVYALERIARESPEDHWAIVQVLAAFVRTHAPAPAGAALDDAPTAAPVPVEAAAAAPPSRPAADVQAALTVIGRRSPEAAEGEPERLDLSGAYLRGINLRGANLARVDFEGACLRRANLEGAVLEDACLAQTDLVGAQLARANLRDADLSLCRLEGAQLLQAHLEGAELALADLGEANLWRAHLEGARLERAVGLTQRQLDAAIVDDATALPRLLRAAAQEDRLA